MSTGQAGMPAWPVYALLSITSAGQDGTAHFRCETLASTASAPPHSAFAAPNKADAVPCPTVPTRHSAIHYQCPALRCGTVPWLYRTQLCPRPATQNCTLPVHYPTKLDNAAATRYQTLPTPRTTLHHIAGATPCRT
jgi:hypothetical protein